VNGEAPNAANLPDAFDSIETRDPNPKADRAALSGVENSRKDAGKTPENHTSNSAADVQTGSPQISSSVTVSADALQLGAAVAASATQVAGADPSAPTSGKSPAGEVKTPTHGADPSVKDGSQKAGAEISNGGNQQATSIPSAQLNSQIGKSGVKIALQSEQFGAVELHTKVTGDQVSASITVDHRETHALLSNDLPALQQILNERQLRVSEIILLHNTLSSSTSSDGDPAAKREGASPQQANASSGNGGGGSAIPASASNGRTGVDAIFDSRGRLSVRA
jgi:hypothetical protein